MSVPRILVTGFGPFPGAPENPSAELARLLARSKRAARYARVSAAIIPTTYADAAALPRLIGKKKPDAVLMFGLAGRARALRIETRGRNRASLQHLDAAGVKGRRLLSPKAPKILRITAPVRELLRSARRAGARARLSSDAGGYVCNAAIFRVLLAARGKTSPLIAFVHIPSPRGRGKSGAGSAATLPTMAALKRAGEAILIALAQAVRAERQGL
jgi:pyroglutamyl-peptidase